LPRRWSTSADIPTSGPPRDQMAPPSDQGEQGGWALEDSNLRPQPCESVLGAFADLGLPTKSQLRR
jgi:hypothetical protein